MKVRNNFILRKIADDYLLIPVGETALKVQGMVALSESGCMLYQMLQTGCARDDLLAAMLREYEISSDTAAADIDSFLDQMRELEMLDED